MKNNQTPNQTPEPRPGTPPAAPDPEETAAQLLINPLTAFILCTKELTLKRDDWLLQTAAGSTLG